MFIISSFSVLLICCFFFAFPLFSKRNRARCAPETFLKLTQHALSGPGVVVPGAHPVLDLLGDLVGVHVVDAAVHGRPEVRLRRRRRSYDVSHLREENEGDGKCLEMKGSVFVAATCRVPIFERLLPPARLNWRRRRRRWRSWASGRWSRRWWRAPGGRRCWWDCARQSSNSAGTCGQATGWQRREKKKKIN